MNWFAITAYESRPDGALRPALVLDERLYDIAGLPGFEDPQRNPLLRGTQHVFEHWEACQQPLTALAEVLRAERDAGRVQALAEGSYRLAVPYRPRRIFGAASNYYEHAAEMGTKLAARSESAPYCFMKADTSVIASGEDVVKPAGTQKLDWEVELGVVIGRTCRHVSVEQAYEVIAGYTVFNDISARDLNRRSDYPFTHDWFRGKSFDTFGPLGPWVVPRDCIAEPQKLRMQLSVNEELMQNETAEGMIFNIAEQIAYLSSMLTLQPGDLIATGTPTGVGMGRGVFLQAGDRMCASIERIGSLYNRVVAEARP